MAFYENSAVVYDQYISCYNPDFHQRQTCALLFFLLAHILHQWSTLVNGSCIPFEPF